jgi:hypothetical protein
VVYRTVLLTCFVCSQTTHPPFFTKVFSMRIRSSVTTTGNLMTPCIILRPHVCLIAFYYDTLHCRQVHKFLIPESHIVAFSPTVVMIWMPVPTLRLQKNAFMPIFVSSMRNHFLRPQLLWHQCLEWTALLRGLILYLATKIFLRHSLTRFKSTLSSLVRISTLAIHCTGGPVATHSFLISLVLQGIFFQFLVSSQSISSRPLIAS